MKEFSAKEYEEMRAKINVRCWKDPSFKQKFMKNPRAAIQELGYAWPQDAKIRVIEIGQNEVIFPLQPAPSHAEKMSDSELKKIAAAGSQWMSTIPC